MANIFNNIRVTKPRRNVFDLSHEHKLTMNMGDLVPVYLQEVVPGDSFKVSTEALIRLAPMLAPVMHRVNIYTHYFFVPNRIIWDSWELFITGGVDGKQNPPFPNIGLDEQNKAKFTKGSLADYFGIPPLPQTGTLTPSTGVSALPFRAYQTIYNEYYRDQTLSAEIPVQHGNVVDLAEAGVITQLRKRAWEKDYFTSALPWAQRGGDVLMPTDIAYKDVSEVRDKFGGLHTNKGIVEYNAGSNVTLLDGIDPDGVGMEGRIENIDGIGTTINELRKAVRLQEWLEKNARAGSRYIEQIFSHFGVRSSDARLQRPEYLGGGKQPVVMSEVLSTFNNETVPGAEMYGHGISVGQTMAFKKTFEEHGYIIGIMSALPRTSYSQGLPKTFLKLDKFDYFWPEFANIGEQEIKAQEIYYDPAGTNSDNEATWGYQSRYAEYKFNNSRISGDFRDNLSFWTMGRIFSGPPSLNESFITSDPTNRIFAVTDDSHKLYVQLYNSVRAIRPMPIFGTPTL